MNRNNPTTTKSTHHRQARLRLHPFTASRISKFAACLILGVATLSQSARAQTPPPAGSYGAYALSNNPVAYWQLDETGNPATGTLSAYDYTGHAYNGTYGPDCYNGYDFIFGPPNPPYLGFAVNQGALLTTGGDSNSVVALPPLNLNTNTVTIAMWINPDAAITANTGLLMNRTAAGDAAGFGFGGTLNGAGTAELGYNWNHNNASAYNFNSGLYPPIGSWSYVVLVIQSNQATIYLDYLDPNNNNQPVLLSAVNSIAHSAEAFSSGLTLIGDDVVNGNAGNSTNVFNGYISDVAVYNSALTTAQVLTLFGAGLGVQGFLPQITTQPKSSYVVAGGTTQISATGINGTAPFSYQWQLNGTNISGLVDPANFTGANSNVLTILNVTMNDAGSYHLNITNVIGVTVSSNATNTVQNAALVGEWLDGSIAASNLLDVSGYSLATNHGAYAIGAGNYIMTNDVPPGRTGQSILLWDGFSGLAISNSSILDAGYDNTFDDVINHAFTIAFWAKNWPSTWSPWVSKDGDFVTYPNYNTTAGWELRSWGSGPFASFTLRDLNVGVNSLDGTSGDDMEPTNTAYATQDKGWHFYTGTFDGGSGVRDLYVDGVLAAQNTNDVPYVLAAAEHLAIGARDQPPGNNYNTGNWATNDMEVFDVRIYNYAITQSAVTALLGEVPATVSGQPQSVAQFTNLPATFTATVSGTQPLALQWQLNGTNIALLADAANFSGANSSALTILSVNANDAGSYKLIVTNLFGSTVSSNATLAIEQSALVGEWIAGSTSLADVSQYSSTGAHDGFAVGSQNYSFTTDVPSYRAGQSISFPASSGSGIAISNSSTIDTSYTNTFDGALKTFMTVSLWAKGTYPAYNGWPPFLCKNEESSGWGLRWAQWGSPCWTVRDNGAGNMVVGNNGGWDGNDDMSAPNGLDGNWHLWTGTYNSITGNRVLYIDGVAVANETGNTPYITAPASHITINCEDSGGGNYGAYSGQAFEFYDMRVYNYELTAAQVQQLYTTLPSGTPAQIGIQPATNITTSCEGVTVQINAQSGGSLPITNQWTFNGTQLTNGTLPDGAIISGANSSSLTIANVTPNEDGLYAMDAANAFGSTVSSNATLTVGTLTTAPAPAGNLVGEWLTGTADLTDHSGYSPQGTHDGYGVNGSDALSSSYSFTNDVPPIAPSGSVSLHLNGVAAIAISNSSIADGDYTNTFDDNLTNALTVEFWAKGVPGGWSGWLSKHGDVSGWQLRVNNSLIPTWTMRGPGNGDDMTSTNGNVDNNWHHYAGTYDSVSGIRNLYVDGVLAAQETGQGALILAANFPLCIGAEYGNNYSTYNNYAPGGIFTGEIYGVHIYNTALTVNQVNASLLPVQGSPTWSGRPVLNGNKLVLTWSSGTLLGATNILGPWTSVAGATSPYTNNVTAAPQMFYKLQ